VGFVILKRNGWKEMTDGDVSLSSEKRLDTYTREAGLKLFSPRVVFLLSSKYNCVKILEKPEANGRFGEHGADSLSPTYLPDNKMI
jgi:hypothetical protein